MAIVGVADAPDFVYHQQSRHATHLQQVDFLLVLIRNDVARVRKAREGQMLVCPVAADGSRIVGCHRQDDRVTRGEGREIIPQAREMCAAIGSQKAAQKDEHNVLFAPEVRQAHCLPIRVRKFEVQGNGFASKDRHMVIIRPMNEILLSAASFPLDGAQQAGDQIDGLGLLLLGADFRHAIPTLRGVIAERGVIAALDDLKDGPCGKLRGCRL